MQTREHHIHVGDLLHLGDDVLVMRSRHLGAVRPVGLVAVVLLGVVRRRHDHTRVAFQLADRKAQLRRRTQRVEEVNIEAVRGENVRHALGEHPRIVAAVVGHGNPHLLARKVLLQVVRKSLRRGANRIDVHAVRTYAHDPAKASRSEFQILVEALDKLLHIIIHQILDLFLRLFVVVSVEPRLRFFQNQLFQFVCHSFYWFYL